MDVNQSSTILNCLDAKACTCFESLPSKHSTADFVGALEYLKHTSSLVDAHLNLIYKHQLSDVTLSSHTFAFVKARVVKQALEHHIETLKLLEKSMRDY